MPVSGQAEVVGRLEVVAGQHAEAAGVLGEGGGDAELGGEVAPTEPQRSSDALGLEPAGVVEGEAQLVAHPGGRGR